MLGDVIWRFDETNPFEETFEESLLEMNPAITDAVLLLLLRVQREPLHGHAFAVGGKTLYVTRTAAIAEEGIPSLQLVYSVDTDQSLIQPVLLSRAAEASAVEAELAAAIATAAQARPAQQRILFPSDPTDVPEDRLEMAVRHAVGRGKSHS